MPAAVLGFDEWAGIRNPHDLLSRIDHKIAASENGRGCRPPAGHAGSLFGRGLGTE